MQVALFQEAESGGGSQEESRQSRQTVWLGIIIWAILTTVIQITVSMLKWKAGKRNSKAPDRSCEF